MEFEVIEQSFRGTVDMLLQFEAYGRYIDMRRLQPPAGGADYIEGLQEWIREKGLEQKFIRGYMRRRKLKKVPDRVLNSIAWGIAIKRAKGKVRRRPWYNKSKSAAISDLFNQVAAGLPDIVGPEVAKQLKK